MVREGPVSLVVSGLSHVTRPWGLARCRWTQPPEQAPRVSVPAGPWQLRCPLSLTRLGVRLSAFHFLQPGPRQCARLSSRAHERGARERPCAFPLRSNSSVRSSETQFVLLRAAG